MTKLVQNDIASLTNEQSALAALNSNYASLETFSDTVLSRDGTSPNQMNADLDMNNNQILNVPSPSALTDLVRLGDIPSLGGTVNLNSPSTLIAGPSVPTAGSTIAANWIWGPTSDRTNAINEGSIWGGKVFTGVSVARSFDATTNSAVGGTTPNIALFVHGMASGTNNDVVSVLGDTNVRNTNGIGFGANFIARSNGGGLTGVKLVGLEIDVEPAAADSVSADSGGFYLNAFNKAIPVGIQLGGISSGTFTDGLIFRNVSGAYVAAGTSPGSVTSGVDFTNATFSSAAFKSTGFTVDPTGNITTNKLTTTVNGVAGLEIKTTGSNNPQLSLYDTTAAGWTMFSQAGVLNFATVNTSGGFVASGMTLDTSKNLRIFGTVLRLDQTPVALAGTSPKTLNVAADSAVNFGHYLTLNMNGTTYYIPCGSVQPV